ncbi:MAG: hypothetical protein P9M11_11930 [Candidatus Tenebribacter burtonii]|jgi:hypothetical protein|nr:hypothetical protein [Candidatus Tenebribacter burtonii]
MKGQIRKNVKGIFFDSLCYQCINLLIQAHQLALEDNRYNANWEEDTFTAHLLEYLDDLKISGQWCINPQVSIYSKEISQGLMSPLTAPRPDIKFEKYTFQDKKPFTYYIEAKNLSENDWQKEIGSKVVASSQIKRYVETGIENFINERYPTGCLAGYVVNGNIKKIVAKINSKLAKLNRSDEYLSMIDLDTNKVGNYISKHRTASNNMLKLKHILIRFYT